MSEEAKEFPKAIPLHVSAQDHIARLDHERKNPELFAPIPIPNMVDLSKIMGGGLPRSEPFVIVVLATEKIGKTTLALALADAWCGANEEGCIYYCLEELHHQISERLLSKYANISRRNIYQRQLQDEDIEAMRKQLDGFKEKRFYLQDSIFRPKNIVKQALDMEIPLSIIDNLQLTDKSGIPGRDTREKLEWISGYFRRARNKHGKSFLIVAQEGQEGKSFGSGQANRDADGILLMKETIKVESTDVNGKKKLVETACKGLRDIVAKPSRLPWNGECTVTFDGDHSSLSDVQVRTVSFNDSDFFDVTEKGEPLLNDL